MPYQKLNDCIIKILNGYRDLSNFTNNSNIDLKESNLFHSLIHKGIYKYKNIIVSGKFGEIFNNMLNDGYNIIVTSSDTEEKGCDLSYIENKIRGKTFIFVDDYFCTGDLRDIIFNEIRRLGGFIYITYCLYDTAVKQDKNVISLYNSRDNKKMKKNICKECKKGFDNPHKIKTDFENLILCPYCFCEINHLQGD